MPTRMETVGSYLTYDDANEHQITLLAAGIDALIDYVPAAEVLSPQSSGIYALRVAPEEAARAKELIAPAIDPEFRSIAKCPRCGSNDVGAIELLQNSDLLLLGLPSIVRMLRAGWHGHPYRCDDCGHRYRRKL
jgi:predicted RNA-binding Zn-ribbon protein involved in translation (DUF1610 family)